MAISVGELLAYLRLDSAQFDRGIVVARQGMTDTAASATRMGSAVGMAETALANAGRQASVASSGTAKFRAAQLGVTAATERYNAVLSDENATIRQLALAEKGLITANERLKASTPTASIAGAGTAAETTTAKMTGFRASMVGTAKMTASLGLAFGVFEAIKKAIDIGKEASAFQKQMTMIQTNANASAAEVKKLTPAVLALSGPVATAPEQLALALYHIEQNGLRSAKAIDVLTVSAKGAKVGNADLEQTTNSMTAAVASGIPGVQNMDQAMGALIATVGTGDMKMQDLNEALGSGMLVKVKAYGLSLRDVGAALAVFGDNNIRGADAATMVVQAVQAMAKPAAGGKKALDSIGLSVDSLKKDMQEGGLNKAILDLDAHLKQAGITGTQTGAFILDAFGKKQSAGVSVLLGQVDRLESKYEELDKGSASFGTRWDETTKTVSFAFDRIKADIESGGIALEMKLLPSVQSAAHWLGTDLPHDLTVLQATLLPVEKEVGGAFTTAWHVLADLLGVVGPALGSVGHFLSQNTTLVKGVVTPVLAMWAAYKGYQIATVAIDAVRFRMATLAATGKNLLTDMRTTSAGVNATFAGNATEAQLSALIQQKAFADIEASAMASAATQDRAAAIKAVAYADEMAASKTASDAEVAAADRAAVAALEQARLSRIAASETAAAAQSAAAEVTLAGDTAAIGWSAMLGPVALLTVGLAALAFGFSHSSDAARKNAEATAAAKQQIQDLTEAIKEDSGVIGQNTEAYVANALQKQGVATAASTLGLNLHTVEQAALGNSTAMAAVTKAYDAYIGASFGAHTSTKAQVDAWALLMGALNGSNSSIKTAVGNYKQMSGLLGTTTAATNTQGSAVANTAKVTQVAAGASQQYAQMLGIVLNESGGTSTAADLVSAAIAKVSKAYGDATESGTSYLGALQTFSQAVQSGALTSADRAAFIGATLKAANGDALNYVGALAQATSAQDALGNAFQQQSQQLANQSKDQANAAASVVVAQKRVDELRANSKTKASTLAAAENALTKAQQSSAKAGALSYSETERAALVYDKAGKIVINYTKAGAAPLVQQLQAMQTAAMGAAQAVYQHEVATKGAKQAATDAYQIYVTQTKGALVDQAEKLGVTGKEAKTLADEYFGMPANVKTQIQAIGTDPVLTVLNKIGALLAEFVGEPWDAKVGVKDNATTTLDRILTRMGKINGTAVVAHISEMDDLKAQQAGGYTSGDSSKHPVYGPPAHKSAAGGYVSGPGTATSDSIPYRLSNGEFVVNAAATARLRPQLETANRSKGSGPFSSGGTAPSVIKHQPIEINVYNPVPERASESVPTAIRRATMRLDG